MTTTMQIGLNRENGTMNAGTWTPADKAALLNRGAEWIIAVRYSYADRTRGDIISWHRSHYSAGRALHRHPNNTFLEILDPADLPADG